MRGVTLLANMVIMFRCMLELFKPNFGGNIILYLLWDSFVFLWTCISIVAMHHCVVERIQTMERMENGIKAA